MILFDDRDLTELAMLESEEVSEVAQHQPLIDLLACPKCHGALKQKAKLRLDTVALMTAGGKSGAAITPGKPADSLLFDRVSDPHESTRMPPEGKPLTAAQVATLKKASSGEPILTTTIVVGADGIFSRRFEMRENDVWLVELSPSH